MEMLGQIRQMHFRDNTVHFMKLAHPLEKALLSVSLSHPVHFRRSIAAQGVETLHQ